MSRADFIVIIIFALIGLFIPIVIVLHHFLGIDSVAILHIKTGRTLVGAMFTLLATFVSLLNFYLSILSPWLYRRQHGSMEDFAQMSGLPMIGGIFVLVGGALMPESAFLGVFFLVLYVMDGNGLPWFFISILRNGV